MTAIGNAISQLQAFLAKLRPVSPDGLLGIVDFSYQHYALGDALTTLAQMAVAAVEHGEAHIDLVLVVDPHRPSTDVQGFVNDLNYTYYLGNVFPAFLCCPMVRSIRLHRDRDSFNYVLASHRLNKAPTWPDFDAHANKRFSFPLGHATLNRFHRERGYLPAQGSPRGYKRWAQNFLAERYPGRFVVCINPRQSALTAQPAVVHRDAPLADWYRFFRHVEQTRPDVLFLMLGGFGEWEHTLHEHPNVAVPRTLGLGLAHELALLHESDLFMGTSSGFATAATFGTTPYAILNIEHFFSEHVEVPVHTPFYPFARENQFLYWEREDADLLISILEQMHRRILEDRQAMS